MGATKKIKSKPEIVNFPNSFSSWYETHHDIVAYVEECLAHEEAGSVMTRMEEQGTGGIYELAFEWTNKFEIKYKSVVWGDSLDYTETLFQFCYEKNQSN